MMMIIEGEKPCPNCGTEYKESIPDDGGWVKNNRTIESRVYFTEPAKSGVYRHCAECNHEWVESLREE